MKLTEEQMKKAVREYNDMMYDLGYYGDTIGTSDSEDTENWNLRDMVAQCESEIYEYIYEDGGNLKTGEFYPEDVEMMKKFIERWLPFTKGMKCTEEHRNSQYD